MTITALESCQATLAAYNALLKNGETLLKEAFKEFFAKHPEVASIGWRQYAPYFNDGAPCTFSVHTPAVKLIPGLSEKAQAGEPIEGLPTELPEAQEPDSGMASVEDDCDLYVIGRRTNSWTRVKGPPQTAFEKALQEDVDAIFDLPDDIFEAAFGSDAKVAVTAKAIQTFSFGHD